MSGWIEPKMTVAELRLVVKMLRGTMLTPEEYRAKRRLGHRLAETLAGREQPTAPEAA